MRFLQNDSGKTDNKINQLTNKNYPAAEFYCNALTPLVNVERILWSVGGMRGGGRGSEGRRRWRLFV